MEGYPNDNQTEEVVVAASNHSEELIVELNTFIRIQGKLTHRTDHIIHFFYNDQGGLGLLHWNFMNSPEKLKKYVTLETREELEAMVGGAQTTVVGLSVPEEGKPESIEPATSATINWQLPDDWRMLSPLRGEVPPVTWLMTSTGDGVSFAIEPVTQQEGIVSGYIKSGSDNG